MSTMSPSTPALRAQWPRTQVRRLALNLIRANPDKCPIRATFLNAAWDDDILLELLTPPS